MAKQGALNAWHFAHESEQERPECEPGGINLLRRLAIEQLARIELLTLPRGSKMVCIDTRWRELTETVTWAYPPALSHDWNFQAARQAKVATLTIQGQWHTSLFVEIGRHDCQLEPDQEEGILIYACPAPADGALRTSLDALGYLRDNATLSWRRMPGLNPPVPE